MKITRSGILVAVILSTTTLARAESRPSAHVGDTFEITRVRDSSSQAGEASSGSSHDKDTIVERIEALRPDGVEVLVDLPQGATANERRQAWQFPARVFKPTEGPRQLLNGPELEKRVDAWLRWGKMTREACGHWFFTWNAFRPSLTVATAPRPPKHSKMCGTTPTSFRSGARPVGLLVPLSATSFQPTITTAAPRAGTRYAAI